MINKLVENYSRTKLVLVTTFLVVCVTLLLLIFGFKFMDRDLHTFEVVMATSTSSLITSTRSYLKYIN